MGTILDKCTVLIKSKMTSGNLFQHAPACVSSSEMSIPGGSEFLPVCYGSLFSELPRLTRYKIIEHKNTACHSHGSKQINWIHQISGVSVCRHKAPGPEGSTHIKTSLLNEVPSYRLTKNSINLTFLHFSRKVHTTISNALYGDAVLLNLVSF